MIAFEVLIKCGGFVGDEVSRLKVHAFESNKLMTFI